MECKNCLNQLASNQKFCPECGGKVVVQRITFKTIFEEFLDKFFNIDNKFYQTFLTLLKQPQEVISGYLEGKRVRYLVQKGFIDYGQLMNASAASYDNEMQKELALKINSYIVEYSNAFAVLFIPLYVFFTKVLFSKYKDYNWAEHFIINIYLYSEAAIISTVVLLLSAFNTEIIVVINMLMFFFQLAYFTYSLQKIFGLSIKAMLLRVLFFVLLIASFFLLILIVGIVIGILTHKG